MTQENKLTTSPIHHGSLGKRMLQGAIPALIVIILFVAPVKNPNPDWPTFWWIRPLLVVPFAGAMGGVFYFLADTFRYQGGWKKVMANVLSVIVYLFGLWMGIVLGLDGTLWD